MNKTLIASMTTVILGKVTVTKDHPLAKSGCVTIAEFDGIDALHVVVRT